MSQEDINYYIFIPKGTVQPSAKAVLENCVPRNMKIVTEVNGEDDHWNWIGIDGVNNQDNQLCIEVIKKTDDLILDIYENYINDTKEDMRQQRAKKWVEAQLENYDYILWFNLSYGNTSSFWKITERAMDYICKQTGAQLLVNNSGFLTNKGTYLAIAGLWLNQDFRLTLASLGHDGTWIHWVYSGKTQIGAVQKEAFLTEDTEVAKKYTLFSFSTDKMRILLY